MKQKDMLLIVVIAIVAGVMSVVISKMVFVTPANRQQAVEVAPVITTTFTQPDSKYFNSSSVDPTQNIQIGNSSNPTPFSGNN